MVEKKPLSISCVIPTYRRSNSLIRCVNALLYQKRIPDEIIIVARKSDKETVKELKKFNKNKKVKSILIESLHHCCALNKGLIHSNGDIVVFTDDDAEPFPDWILKIEEHFKKRDDISALGGPDEIPDEKNPTRVNVQVGKLYSFGYYIGNHHLNTFKEKPFEVDILKGVNMAFRKEKIKDFRFDETFFPSPFSHFTELDICLYIKKKNRGRILFDPDLKVKHYALPRTGFGERGINPSNVYTFSHNILFVCLTYFNSFEKILTFLFNFLIGFSVSPGILRAPFYLLNLEKRKILKFAFKGKKNALKHYRLRKYENLKK